MELYLNSWHNALLIKQRDNFTFTSQETRYVSATKTDRLMLSGKQFLSIVRAIRNTQMHCVGIMQSLNMLKEVLGSKGLNGSSCIGSWLVSEVQNVTISVRV
jgi:hypothetical protein